ncbi:hypothetical protein [Agrobacterium fabrum]|uniref:hypothetical protein n=1 Tax=Agrobacterium fabrum TaxID=1176649 RepID=UPI000EF494E6|nr:hypothetical protein [Agrobacterium fabrum]AYM60895.1 hypothetical protein At1D132_48880 [Agrobacterium fabrum]NSZ14723.1 hypothetical protein [Agrobacterium fabrum]
MRKPSRKVELDDIIAGQILGEDPDVIALVMKIHLALEALLIEMMRAFSTDDKIYKLSFPTKTEALEKHGLIGNTDRAAFDRFNDFRNDFAHIFAHQVTLAGVLCLARDLEAQGVDFSDSVGHYSEAQASEYYGGRLGVLEEVGWCILFHASHTLCEAGGRNIFSAPA